MRTRGSRSNNGFVGINAGTSESVENIGIVSGNNAFSAQGSWFRPSNWLAMPDMTAGDQRIALLVAIPPAASTGSNFGATGPTAAGTLVSLGEFVLEQAGTNYIVDWGGITTQIAASGTRSPPARLIKYDDLPSSTTVIENEGYNAGYRNYRQLLVQVYPQSSSGTFRDIRLGETSISSLDMTTLIGSGVSSAGCIATPKWLSIKGASSTMKVLSIGTTGGASGNKYLKEFEWIGPTSLTNCSNIFNGCGELVSIKGTEWCKNGQNFNNIFANCTSLETIPLLNTSSAKSVVNMFSRCINLREIPCFDTSNVTNFTGMFNNCAALRSIPLLNTTNARNMSFMFNGCYSLVSIPELNTSQVTNFSSMFTYTKSLNYLPTLNTANGVTATSMFAASGLRNVPPLNMTNMTSLQGMFSSSKVEQVYLFNNENPAKNSFLLMSDIFQSCYHLRAAILQVSPNTLSPIFSGSFGASDSLRELIIDAPLYSNTSNGILFNSGARYVRRFLPRNGAGAGGPQDAIPATTVSTSLTSQPLSAEALNEMYRGLGTVGSSGSNTRWLRNLRKNWGYDGSLTGIASAKGWNTDISS